MGSRASCCQEDIPEPPKELVEASHACEDPKEGGSSKLDGGKDLSLDADKGVPVEVLELPQSEAVLSKWSRLREMRQLEVDAEILRGISLRASPRRGGRLWRCSPLDLDERERGQLWSKSRYVEHFDVFLSHTWHTSGAWKMLSLLLQAGWKWVIFLYGVMVVVVALLHAADSLPLPFDFTPQCPNFTVTVPYAPWTLLLTFFSSVIAMLSAPYLPEGYGAPLVWDAVCFLDAVSIHQTDAGLMERGVYGLGGFLKVSKELRVLWSRPYLSRLWCVFELAAYRHANPSGRITLAPLFIERAMLILFFATYFASSLFITFVILGGFQSLNPLIFGSVYFVGLCPYLFVIHVLRCGIREKHHLLTELKSFDLDKAETRSDFDRAFVHSAIEQWYGSKEAFVNYVRGPLREELLSTRCTSLPLSYAWMTSIVTFTTALDDFTALLKGGADVNCLLSTLFGFGFGLQVCWFVTTVRVVSYLVERYAEPWWSGWADHLQTFVIYIFTYLWFMLGGVIAQLTCRSDLWMAIVWLIVSAIINANVSAGWGWWARPHHPNKQPETLQ